MQDGAEPAKSCQAIAGGRFNGNHHDAGWSQGIDKLESGAILSGLGKGLLVWFNQDE
jgi:hypothetical protein